MQTEILFMGNMQNVCFNSLKLDRLLLAYYIRLAQFQLNLPFSRLCNIVDLEMISKFHSTFFFAVSFLPEFISGLKNIETVKKKKKKNQRYKFSLNMFIIYQLVY